MFAELAKRHAARPKWAVPSTANTMGETANPPHTPCCHICLGFAQKWLQLKYGKYNVFTKLVVFELLKSMN